MRDARLVVLNGAAWMPYEDATEVADLAIHFVRECGEDSDRVGASAGPHSAGLRTVLFTGLVGHTEMMRRLGDDRGREVLREHERITRELLKEFGGAEVKTMGDGFMASFASVTKAMDCAIALQRAFAAHEGEPLQVRVGLNAGEPIEEDGVFVARFGEPFRLKAPAGTSPAEQDAYARTEVMARIGALLPPPYLGAYAEEIAHRAGEAAAESKTGE